jgi:titin
MSDYSIIGATATFNPASPAKIPENSTINITVSLLFSGTIVDPIDLTAVATTASADAVTWTQSLTDTVTAATLEFTVTAEAGPVLQPVCQYRQNYLVTLTDGDARTQVFNIALNNEDGYPTAVLDVIDNYPSPRGALGEPPAPTDLALTQTSFTEYLLTWSPGSGGGGVVGYTIGRAIRSGTTSGPFAELVADTGNTDTMYTDTGLSTKTRYVYKVAALNVIMGTSDFSAESPTIAEEATSLVASAGGRESMDLSWTAPSDSGNTDIIGYKIERESPTGGGFSVIVADTGSTATNYNDTGLSIATEYNYRIYTLNSVGESVVSNEAADMTDPITVSDAPTALVATAVGVSQIDLSWTTPGDDGGSAITGYRIDRESPEGGGFATIVADTGSTMTTYSDATVSGGTEYNYQVFALNGLGTSAGSNTAKDTTPTAVPDAPTGLTATAFSATQIDLSWTAGADNGSPITGYQIERESPIGGGFSVIVADTGSTMTTYSNTGLVGTTQYNYRVSAINGNGTGPASNEDDATTL